MSTILHYDVRAFHRRFGHPVREKPAVPTDDEMRFRLKLITEEFFELLGACVAGPISSTHEAVRMLIAGPLKVDLPELVDAMGDLDYVVEGTRAVCGVDGSGIAHEIHCANMAKDPVYVAAKDEHHREPDPMAKPRKPSDWAPPDIEGELRRQGWEP